MTGVLNLSTRSTAVRWSRSKTFLKGSFTVVAVGSGEHFRMSMVVLSFQIFTSVETLIGRYVGAMYTVISAFAEGKRELVK